MKEFTQRYYPSVFAAISRLTRLQGKEELEALTNEVLADLWERRDALNTDDRQGIFIYRTILKHIFSYLKQKGDENRINFLRNTLPINPEFYTRIGDSEQTR